MAERTKLNDRLPPMAKLAVLALTAGGAELAKGLARGLGADLFLPGRLNADGLATSFDSLKTALSQRFGDFRGHVIVAATGLTVRLIAPLIADKKTDPAVVAMGQDGRLAAG